MPDLAMVVAAARRGRPRGGAKVDRGATGGLRASTVVAAAQLLAPVGLACVLASLLSRSFVVSAHLALGAHVLLATVWGARRGGLRGGLLAGCVATALAFRADLLGPATRGTVASLLVLVAWAPVSTPLRRLLPWHAALGGALLGVAVLFHGACWWLLPGLVITPWVRSPPAEPARRMAWALATAAACLAVVSCGMLVLPASSVHWMWMGAPSAQWSPSFPCWTEYLLGQSRLGPLLLIAVLLGLATRGRRPGLSAETHLLAAAIAAFSLHEATGGTLAPAPGLLAIVVVPASNLITRSWIRLGLLRGRGILPAVAVAAIPACAAIWIRWTGAGPAAHLLASRIPMKVAEALPLAMALALGACEMRRRATRRRIAWLSYSVLVATALAGLEVIR